MSFQIGTSVLDACVLSALQKNDQYGYSLTQEIRKVMDISDSTMYPVLKRLKKDGYVVTYEQPFEGRNRRYYTITDEGREKFNYYIEEWLNYREMMNEIMMGEGDKDE
jgi:Predicted transcriptional regulators